MNVSMLQGAIAVVVLLTFLVLGLALASMLFKEKKSAVQSRVAKLRSVPKELEGELAPAFVVEDKSHGLLSAVDISPLIGKFTGEDYFSRVEADLAQADIPLKVSEFIIIRLGFAGLFAFLVTAMTKSFLIGAVCGLLTFFFAAAPFIMIRKRMRLSKFTVQLADFLTLIVNSLRAGQTFMQGCQIAVQEAPKPISVEFKQLIKEVNLGMAEAESLENMLKRVPSEDLKIALSAYIIQRRVGGNLAEILETTAVTIRERIKIQGQIDVLTTQGKLSGVLVGSLPVVMSLIMSSMNSKYMEPLLGGSLLGYIIIGIAVFLEVLGAFCIWKIVDIKI